MNRFKIRLGLPALAVAGVLAVLAALLSGCGAGQVSQMAVQEPAINGNKVTFKNVALRDIRIQANQTGDYVQPGRTVDLVLVAVNLSANQPDRLVGITTFFIVCIELFAMAVAARLPYVGVAFFVWVLSLIHI